MSTTGSSNQHRAGGVQSNRVQEDDGGKAEDAGAEEEREEEMEEEKEVREEEEVEEVEEVAEEEEREETEEVELLFATQPQVLVHVIPEGQGYPISHCSPGSMYPSPHCTATEDDPPMNTQRQAWPQR